MYRSPRLYVQLTRALLLLLLALALIPGTQPTRAQEVRCFEQTGRCIEGRFLEYWERHGGLMVFGYPTTSAREERNHDTGKLYLTQWFERVRFELHPQHQPPYDVLLGRLGADVLRKASRDWGAPDSGAQAGCLWFAETQRNVCNQAGPQGFKRYWETHGLEFDGRAGTSHAESLALFGLPITEPRMETNSSGDTVLTQWFERARFEWHPGNPDQHKVLLGLLGNEARVPLKRVSNPGLPGSILVQAGGLHRVTADGSQAWLLQESFDWEGGLALSPDGRRLATRCWDRSEIGLCAMNLNTANTLRLNTDPGSVARAWSPDGRRIAYASYSDGRRGLYVANADGSGEQRIFAGSATRMPGNVSWAPDSRQLVFDVSYDETALYIASADGTQLRKLAEPAAQPGWSPDGQRIVYSSSITGNEELYTIRPDGTETRRLTSTQDREVQPHWSPDGRHIAVLRTQAMASSPVGVLTGLAVLPASGGAAIAGLQPDHSNITGFRWSPDSAYLVYNVTCAERICGRSRVEVLKPGSSEHWPILFSEQEHVHPTPLAWLP